MNSKATYILSLVVFFVGGFCTNILYSRFLLPPTTVSRSLRETDANYNLIKPLLLCSENSSFYEYKPLESKLNTYINGKIKDGSAENISVYIKEAMGGTWVGINEDEYYSPASLVKVPLMLAYYRLAESDPSILNKTLVYTGKTNSNNLEYFKPTRSLVAGSVYTIDQLIRYMIVDSDNNAYDLLLQDIDQNSLGEAYTDLGITLPPVQSDDDVSFMSAKLTATFFRILYNSTYLDRLYSQKALDLLTQTTFSQGLKAGVPQNVVVADKFGERSKEEVDGPVLYRELHDCGFVYGKNPYTICVMTKGQDFDALSTIIKDMSKMTYDVMNTK